MPRAVILTALPVEYLAVRNHLTNPQEEMHPQGTIYERGSFDANGQSWEVGIAEVGAGNAVAALEAQRAIDYFKPEILFFVGIAGGIKDVEIGDVVAATKVYGYESGKVGEQFLTRPEAGQSAYALVQRARSEAREGDWLQRLSSIPALKPRVLLAPIAAGEKVVASKQSDVFRFLRASYNDAIAVEMEGFGFLSAAFAYPNIEAIVIRGISDLIDGKNDDAVEPEDVRQAKASHHASAFAFEILANKASYSATPSSNRRDVLRWLGFGGTGVIAFVLSTIGGRKNPQLRPIEPSSLQNLSITEFSPVKLNKKGTIVAQPKTQIPIYTEDLGNTISLKMVKIPAGEFSMGSTTEEGRYGYESPQHKVKVPEFYISQTLVTQAQWQQIMKNNPAKFKGDDNLPVEQISWIEAQKFCQELSQSTHRKHRLPSEAEWEYACRAGTTTPFYFGTTISSEVANYRAQDEKVEDKIQPGKYGNGKLGEFRNKTTPVGHFPPNGFGLYDMHGNLWEWCLDHWHENYDQAPSDGSAWLSDRTASRLVRGSSWLNIPRYCRSASRSHFPHDSPHNGPHYDVGFRVVCEILKTL
jgi:formylglycine-generating enzyme required for sulfatase activity/nucleoside phosphorylase